MTNSKLVVAALAALSLTAGRAYAEGEDPCGGDPCGGGEEMGGDPCGGGEGGEAKATGEEGGGMAEEGGAMAGDYPQAVIDRPRVLPKGMLEAVANVGIAKISLLGASSTGISLGIGARYGLAPKIDAQLTYGFSLKEFEIKGDLAVVAQYSLAESDKLGVAARLSTGYSVVGEEFSGVGLGLNLQYKVTPKIAVFTNGDHLSFGGSDFPKPVSINLPVGVGFQANEKINAFLSTSLASIAVSPSEGTAIIGRDGVLAILGGTFSPSNKLDIGASFVAPDIEFVADFWIINLTAAYRM